MRRLAACKQSSDLSIVHARGQHAGLVARRRTDWDSPDPLDVVVLLRVRQGRDDGDVQVACGLTFLDVLWDSCCDVVVHCVARSEAEDLLGVDEYLACLIGQSGFLSLLV